MARHFLFVNVVVLFKSDLTLSVVVVFIFVVFLNFDVFLSAFQTVVVLNLFSWWLSFSGFCPKKVIVVLQCSRRFSTYPQYQYKVGSLWSFQNYLCRFEIERSLCVVFSNPWTAVLLSHTSMASPFLHPFTSGNRRPYLKTLTFHGGAAIVRNLKARGKETSV